MVVTVFAGDGLDHDALGQFGVTQAEELVGGDEFAAGVTGHIRNQAFDFGDAVFAKPIFDRLNVGVHGDSTVMKALSILKASQRRKGG
ncbi:hypothetical protein GCM10027297_22670 [Parahaliea aestuarii]